MKKYKLIKEYPGSPKLDTIVISPLYLYNNNMSMIEGSLFETPKWENTKLFWQEIIEKDYEILEYKTEYGIICKAPFLKDSEQFYINQNCKINSIKRLSDGEIFTIGDDVIFKSGKGKCCYKEFRSSDCVIDVATEIVSFVIQEDTLTIQIEYNKLCYSLDAPEKVKQPLFTTEDGVDIFKNDIFWSINSKFEKIERQITNDKWSKDFIFKDKHFSTKEKAEEYILMNKPCLSLSDVWDNLKVKDQKEVMKFVKSKLNK